MPVADDPDRPGGRILLDAEGEPVARFDALERNGHRTADLLELEAGVTTDAAVRAVRADLAGWRVAARVDVGRALIAAGAAPRRDAHVRSRDLVRRPADPGWLEPAAP